jgi:TRAP-type transport system large permease protein
MLTVLIIFLFLLAFGMPVAFAIGVSGVVFFLMTPEIPFSIVVQRVVASTQFFTLLAIPLFIFAGNLMNNTGITKKLIKLSDVLTGHMYGNIAQISIVLSTMMGGVSGSSTADAAMETRILGPEMVKKGYSKGYSAAVNGWSALITSTIPPSMGFVIFGAIGEVSIGRLFAGGIIPGIIMMISLMIVVSISSRKRGYMPARKETATLREVFIALKESVWALIFPIILIVGIRFGVFTPSEAGAFAAVYAVFVGFFIYKELTWELFKKTLRDSAMDIGAIMIIIAFSGIVGYGIVYDRVSQRIATFLLEVSSNPVVLLWIIITFLIVAGMFVETTVIALLLTPILLPVVTRVGIDPVHFGVVMMINVTMGIMTPPLGVALYTVSSIMECPPEDTVKESLPFFVGYIITDIILISFPQLVLFIPNLIFD